MYKILYLTNFVSEYLWHCVLAHYSRPCHQSAYDDQVFSHSAGQNCIRRLLRPGFRGAQSSDSALLSGV